MSSPQTVWMPGPLRVEIHLAAADTGGELCLLIDYPRPGWALPPHRHANEAETIHVLEGRFALEVDGVRHECGPGESVHIPRGVLHSGSLLDDAPGRRVVVFTPGGIDAFFAEVGAATAEEEVEIPVLLDAAERHGWTFASMSG